MARTPEVDDVIQMASQIRRLFGHFATQSIETTNRSVKYIKTSDLETRGQVYVGPEARQEGETYVCQI